MSEFSFSEIKRLSLEATASTTLPYSPLNTLDEAKDSQKTKNQGEVLHVQKEDSVPPPLAKVPPDLSPSEINKEVVFLNQRAIDLERAFRKIKEERAQAEKIYKEYHENRLASNLLQTEILRGLRQGEDAHRLLLKASRAISLMTCSEVFYKRVESDLVAIYGEGLGEPAPLETELEETKGRLERLERARGRPEISPEAKEGIEAAIKGHKASIARLQSLISKGKSGKSIKA